MPRTSPGDLPFFINSLDDSTFWRSVTRELQRAKIKEKPLPSKKLTKAQRNALMQKQVRSKERILRDTIKDLEKGIRELRAENKRLRDENAFYKRDYVIRKV